MRQVDAEIGQLHQQLGPYAAFHYQHGGKCLVNLFILALHLFCFMLLQAKLKALVLIHHHLQAH